MKKTLLFVAILVINVISTQAQLVVDSLGNVGIGTENPSSPLSVYLPNLSQYASIPVMKVSSRNSYGTCVGVDSRITGGSTYACAVRGVCDSTFSTPSIGVLGNASGYPSAGIYGGYFYGTFNYPGAYAGYFSGNVRVTGSTYSSAYLTATGSTYYGMDGFGEISRSANSTERVTDKLAGLKTVMYQRDSRTADIDSETSQRVSKRARLSEIQYGLVAEQLKEVYPELVYEDAEGNVSINYVEMVPLLVQSIRELSEELAELKGTSAKSAKAKKKTAQSTAIEETAEQMDQVRMDQNKPNPFSGSTVVTLSVPDKAKSAAIYIYDLSGKQVQKVDVAERGQTDITLYASGLGAGMYVYSLVVDGKVRVTRRMMISEG